MRYLIIKHDEIKEDGMLMNMLSGIEHYGVVLSEEETLAKFKEIWDSASESTENHTWHPEHIERPNIQEDWADYIRRL